MKNSKKKLLIAKRVGKIEPPDMDEIRPNPVRMFRKEDFLRADFYFNNFGLKKWDGPYKLHPKDFNKDGIITLLFPPQHIVESSFTKPPVNTSTNKITPIETFISGKSWVTFKIDKSYFKELFETGTNNYSFDLDGIFRLITHKYSKIVTKTTDMPDDVFDYVPRKFPTAIEAPVKLVVTPSSDYKLVFSPVPKVNDYNVMWHASFLPVDKDVFPLEALTYDIDENDNQVPYIPLKSKLREYVFKNQMTKEFRSEEMILSSLGIWMDTKFGIDPAPFLKIEDRSIDAEMPPLEYWGNQSRMGRDQYVKIVNIGWLYPFGHSAAFITLYKRTFSNPKGGVSAEVKENLGYLSREHYIVPLNKIKTFAFEQLNNEIKFGMPFRSVEILTKIKKIKEPIPADMNTGEVFWPIEDVDGDKIPVSFDFEATDLSNNVNKIKFTAPLVYAPKIDKIQSKIFRDVKNAYTAGIPGCPANVNAALRKIKINSQEITFAEEELKVAATKFLTDCITFTADWNKTDWTKEISHINMEEASIYIPGMKELFDKYDSVRVAYENSNYILDGFKNKTKNYGEVFFTLKDEVQSDILSKYKELGILFTPKIDVGALSRKTGIVAKDAIKDFMLKNFTDSNLTKYIPVPSGMKLFGQLDLLQFIGFPKVDPEKILPGLSQRWLDPFVEIKYHWENSGLKESPDNKFIRFIPDKTGKLDLQIQIDFPIKNADKTKASYKTSCELSNFKIDLASSLITIHFSSIKYSSETDRNNDVRADVDKVSFGRDLEFIKSICQALIPKKISPFIAFDVNALKLQYPLPIPSMSIGVFSLSNLSIHTNITLPFNNTSLHYEFGLSSPANPFMVTAGIFAGGGYIIIGIFTDGRTTVLAGIEFGVGTKIDIGVAKGAVFILAGILFSNANGITLGGYVRCGGNLDILGLISASVLFYAILVYHVPTKTLRGSAEVIVHIDILFFSKDVTLGPVSYVFEGSSGLLLKENEAESSTFAELINEQDWKNYCQAFSN